MNKWTITTPYKSRKDTSCRIRRLWLRKKTQLNRKQSEIQISESVIKNIEMEIYIQNHSKNIISHHRNLDLSHTNTGKCRLYYQGPLYQFRASRKFFCSLNKKCLLCKQTYFFGKDYIHLISLLAYSVKLYNE